MVKVRITQRGLLGYESFFKEITKKELLEYKQKVYKSMSINWKNTYKGYNHAVFYSELNDKNGNPYYANIYLDGSAFVCDEQAFEELYQRPRQFTIALHRGALQ